MPDIDQNATDIQRPTRGLKNRNPGNLRFVATIPWQGQIGEDSLGFAVFDTDVNGLRAMIINLHTLYARNHDTTILAIISAYAPPVENNTDEYAAVVGKEVGFDPSATIPAFTPEVATSLIRAMVHMEQGVDPYDDMTYGHAAALAFMHINGGQA